MSSTGGPLRGEGGHVAPPDKKGKCHLVSTTIVASLRTLAQTRPPSAQTGLTPALASANTDPSRCTTASF